MSSIAELLRQLPALRSRAFEHTRDTNEAYLLVHNVMAGAANREGGDHDLNAALARAIALWTERIDRAAAAT